MVSVIECRSTLTNAVEPAELDGVLVPDDGVVTFTRSARRLEVEVVGGSRTLGRGAGVAEHSGAGGPAGTDD
jgi:hypothetical protein